MPLISINLTNAQTQGCDEGVIRLPDRNGTIQICSAFASKVPQLSKQMSDVSKLLGSQQKQIEELTRLIKGINGVSRDLSSDRQEQLLINLTRELQRASSRGESINKRDFETTIDRVDELNNTISKVYATPNGTNEIRQAMSSDLGASISRLEFNTAQSQLDDIQSKLKVIETGVKDIQKDTTAIRQDLNRMQTQSIEALKNISNEIRALGSQGGVVAQPKTYAETYHNARIFAQRGEFDQSVLLYQKLFDFKIQMADPIADLVTLARRLYGVKGARDYFDKKLKDKMPKASYLYAQLLMIDPGRESEFRQKDFASLEEWLVASEQFPPLAYQQLKVDNPHKLYYQEQSWSSWKFYFNLYKIVDNSISKGEFLAFYVDQIRGGTQIDAYSQMSLAPFFEDLFFFVLRNPGMPSYQNDFDRLSKSQFSDKLIEKFRLVDLEKSPVIIDYTYFNEGPVFWSYHTDDYFTWMKYPGAPKRENGLIRLSIWDPYIDQKSPIQMCSKNDRGVEYCINLLDNDKSCSNLKGMHALSERYKCFTVFGDVMTDMFYKMPNADATFLPQDWLKSNCISRITYTNGNGQKVNFLAKDFVATYRWPKGRSGNEDLSSQIDKCGYQNQSIKEARKGWLPFKNSF